MTKEKMPVIRTEKEQRKMNALLIVVLYELLIVVFTSQIKHFILILVSFFLTHS